MARTQQNLSSSATITREDALRQIALDLATAVRTPKSGLSLTDRLVQYVSDKLADTGSGIAEIWEGASAGVDNFALHRESARRRQEDRTAAKIAALAEKELARRGL